MLRPQGTEVYAASAARLQAGSSPWVTPELPPSPHALLPPEKEFLGGPGKGMRHYSGFSVPCRAQGFLTARPLLTQAPTCRDLPRC